MNNEEKGNSLEPEEIASTGIGSKLETTSAGACETWLEECEGHFQDNLFHGRAKRLLGRRWIFSLRRNLTPLQKDKGMQDRRKVTLMQPYLIGLLRRAFL